MPLPPAHINVTSVTMKIIERKDLVVTLHRSINKRSSKVFIPPFLSWMEPLIVLWRQSKKIQSANSPRVVIHVMSSNSSLKDQRLMAYGLQKIIQLVWKEDHYGFSRANTEPSTDFRKANTKPSMHFRRAYYK